MFRTIGSMLLFVPSMALVAPRATLPRKCATHAHSDLFEERLFSSRRAVLSTTAAAAAAWLAPSGAIARSAPTDEALADLMANPGDVAEKVNALAVKCFAVPSASAYRALITRANALPCNQNKINNTSLLSLWLT